MSFSVLEIVLIGLSLVLLFTTIKLTSRVRVLEEKLATGMKRPFTESPVKAELLQLLREGQDVKAVKRVRETSGLSLLAAKQYIDQIKRELLENEA